MTPKKGGYTTPSPALDRTTSTRGDWYFTKGSVTGAPLPDPPPLLRGAPTTPPPPAQANFPPALGGPHRFRVGSRIRGGPQVGKVATYPLPPVGSPHLQSGGQNQKWPTSGQGGYISPAAWGIPTALERGAESEVARKSARWLHNPCRLGGPHRFRAGGRIRSGPQVGKVAIYLLPPGGSPLLQSGGQNQKWPISGQGGYISLPPVGSPQLQSGGQNQKWPTSGQGGYITPATWGVPTALERGAKSEVAHKWARWLHIPCRLGRPHRFRAGGRIRSGLQAGKVAT